MYPPIKAYVTLKKWHVSLTRDLSLRWVGMPLDISICTYNRFRVFKRYRVSFTHDDSHKIPPPPMTYVECACILGYHLFLLEWEGFFALVGGVTYRLKNPQVLQVLQLLAWCMLRWEFAFSLLFKSWDLFFFCCLTTLATSSPNNQATYFLPYIVIDFETIPPTTNAHFFAKYLFI